MGHIISNTGKDRLDIINRRNSLCAKINNVLCYFKSTSIIIKIKLLMSYFCRTAVFITESDDVLQ